MTHIQMRPANRVPRRAFVNALNDAYVDYFVPIFVSVSFLRDMITRESLRLDHSVAAVAGRDVVGTGLLGVRERCGWVGGVGVVPGYRRQGIARQMMHYLMDNAAALDLATLQLEVIDENTPALRLYESLGFVTRRTLYMMVSDGGVGQQTRSPDGFEVDVLRGPVGRSLIEELPHPRLPWQRDPHVMATYAKWLYTLTLREGQRVVAACAFVMRRADLQVMYVAALDPSTGPALMDALYAAYPGRRMTYLNVAADDPLLPALYEAGFTVGVTQYEMIYEIE